MTPLVALHEVHKTFHQLAVVDRITCAVAEGETLSLVGPSGCGKSTLLRLMSGIEAPDHGIIDSHFRRAGFVFQEPRLLPWRTAVENVTLTLLDAIPNRSQREARARDMLRVVGLSGFENYHPAQLSGGMRQRVAIARALAIDPDFVLLDEPFYGLDFALRLRLIEFLRQLLADGRRTAVYVTHDVREALILSDRLVVLSARPARIREVFDLRDAPHKGWHLGARLQEIESRVVEMLLTDEEGSQRSSSEL